jgi:hypothetical protein
MHRALSESDVPAALTINPALYFKATKKGVLKKNSKLISSSSMVTPVADARSFAKVAYGIRSGHTIYQRP